MRCPRCGKSICDCLLDDPGFLARAVGKRLRLTGAKARSPATTTSECDAEPRHEPSKVAIKQGDVLEILQTLSANVYEGCICDPPYALTSIGKRFGGKNSTPPKTDRGANGKHGRLAHGFMCQTWNSDPPSAEVWQEVLRVCKPGSWLLACGSPRTFHRLASNIEDAGWESRDCVMWLYGTGFPKSHRINAEGWDGYGFALKPAYEPIILAMKPLDGSFVENAYRWGVAGLNIDGCRIPCQDKTPRPVDKYDNAALFAWHRGKRDRRPNGRWPANVVLDEKASRMLGTERRYFYCPKASTRERNAGLEHFPIRRPDKRTGKSIGMWDKKGIQPQQNHHPCVKPIALTEWLARLILPPRDPRRLLVPYCGSGSEILGAIRAGWNEILGIERDKEYIRIANARLNDERVRAHA